MNDAHHHGESDDSQAHAAEPGELVAVLRSVQDDLGGHSDGVPVDAAARLDQVAEGIVALGDELERLEAHAAHLKWHYVECESSTSYRIGHAVVRVGRVPGRLVSSLRSRTAQ